MIDIVPLSSRIGAEVTGITLNGDLSEGTVADLKKELINNKVLFFRDQNLTAADHVAFGRLFGELEIHPFVGANAEHPELMVLERGPKENRNGPYGENTWHTDVSWRQTPSYGSILRAKVVPPKGGDTLWADMEAAYAGLSQTLRDALVGLTAVHDFRKSFGHRVAPEDIGDMMTKFPPVEHPVVRTNPDTGAKILYVCESFTTHIVGMDRRESDELLKLLYRQAAVPEYQTRLSWRPGTVAFWDNRCTQHYAVNDFKPAERVMERVTVVGDMPF